MADEIHIKTNIGQNPHSKNQGNTEPYVDIEDEKCVLKWASVLHISPEELRGAVHEFGPKIRKIRLGLTARERNKAA